MSHFKVTIKDDKTYELYNKNDNTTRTYKTKGNCMKQLKKSLDKETAKLVLEGKFIESYNSDDELDREIEEVKRKQIEMEKKIEKRRILKMEQERLLKMKNEYIEMEKSFPLVENKWKKNGKKMENNLPLVENNLPLVEEILPLVENNFSIRDIDLVPNIESPTMTITRPTKLLMPSIPLDEIPITEVKELKTSTLADEEESNSISITNKEYDIDKIKVILHMIMLKKFNKL